jgi:hypothetical protein
MPVWFWRIRPVGNAPYKQSLDTQSELPQSGRSFGRRQRSFFIAFGQMPDFVALC